MKTLYFQIDKAKKLKDNTHPIYLILKLRQEGKERRFRYYTGETVTESGWISKEGKPFGGYGKDRRVYSKYPGASTINSKLRTLAVGAEGILANADNLKHEITIEYFEQRFFSEVVKKPGRLGKGTTPLFWDALDQYIERQKSVIRPNSLKALVTLKGSLKDYENETGYRLTFDSINSSFEIGYKRFLVEREMIDSTIAKRFSVLKTFMRAAQRLKYHNNTEFTFFRVKHKATTTIIYLTETEVEALEKVKLEPGSTLDYVRDAFLFSCYTGIRHSDWGKVRPEQITKVDTGSGQMFALSLTTEKTTKPIRIPISERAMSILRKYEFKPGEPLIPQFENASSNRLLKDIAKMAKINDVIIEVKESGANKIQTTNKKWEVLTCHHARNTFATIYLERGGRPEVLQRILGHANIRQTMAYVKVVDKTIFTDFERVHQSAKVVKLGS